MQGIMRQNKSLILPRAHVPDSDTMPLHQQQTTKEVMVGIAVYTLDGYLKYKLEKQDLATHKGEVLYAFKVSKVSNRKMQTLKPRILINTGYRKKWNDAWHIEIFIK
jgi:phosphotransferase system IIA component